MHHDKDSEQPENKTKKKDNIGKENLKMSKKTPNTIITALGEIKKTVHLKQKQKVIFKKRNTQRTGKGIYLIVIAK